MEKEIKRDGLFKYTFFNEQQKETAVIDIQGIAKILNNDNIQELLNIENLKKILKVEEIIVDEVYRK